MVWMMVIKMVKKQTKMKMNVTGKPSEEAPFSRASSISSRTLGTALHQLHSNVSENMGITTMRLMMIKNMDLVNVNVLDAMDIYCFLSSANHGLFIQLYIELYAMEKFSLIKEKKNSSS